MDTSAVPPKSHHFSQLTVSEISSAILGVSNSTRGQDGFPSVLLRLAWPLISELVKDLLQACMDIGHHSLCFRTSTVTFIHKTNKADFSSPNSYRPISFLSVLSGGLERLVTR